jgi:hypothetical protein
MEYRMRVIDVSYPGQSEYVRVGLGITVVIVYDDGTIRSPSLGWADRPYPKETLPWGEFYKKYKGHPIVEREERDRIGRLER